MDDKFECAKSNESTLPKSFEFKPVTVFVERPNGERPRFVSLPWLSKFLACNNATVLLSRASPRFRTEEARRFSRHANEGKFVGLLASLDPKPRKADNGKVEPCIVCERLANRSRA